VIRRLLLAAAVAGTAFAAVVPARADVCETDCIATCLPKCATDLVHKKCWYVDPNVTFICVPPDASL
jgi:hypothetical protein